MEWSLFAPRECVVYSVVYKNYLRARGETSEM